MASFPRLEEPLGDGVVLLRPSAERDIPEILIAYQDDPGLARALGEARPPSGAMLGRRAELAGLRWEEGTGLVLTALEAGSDVCRGEVRISGVDWAAGRAELAVWLVPAARGRGLGRRAHGLAVRWLSQECRLMASCPDGVPGEAASGGTDAV